MSYLNEKSKNKGLDLNTFGNTKAALAVIRVLDELDYNVKTNKQDKIRLSRIYSNTNKILNAVDNIDPSIRSHLINLIEKDTIEKIEKRINSQILKELLRTIVHTKIRKMRQKIVKGNECVTQNE